MGNYCQGEKKRESGNGDREAICHDRRAQMRSVRKRTYILTSTKIWVNLTCMQTERKRYAANQCYFSHGKLHRHLQRFRSVIHSPPTTRNDKIMQTTSNHFRANGGTRLFEQIWCPNQAPKAVLVIVHGYTEHSGRYQHFAHQCVHAGISVEAFDLRGHGKSDGPRGFVNDFQDYVHDLAQFLIRVRERNAHLPVFLFAHSLGGTISTQLVSQESPDLSGLIFSGAALTVGDSVSRPMQYIAKALSCWFPKIPTVPIGTGSVITRNPSAIKDYDQDPLVYRGRVPARTGAEVLRAIQNLQLDTVRTPLLILHGTADRVTDLKGSQQLYMRAQTTDKTFKPYEGLYHSLLEESEKDQVIDDILSWITQRIPTQSHLL
jgi:acylglycerol lipase